MLDQGEQPCPSFLEGEQTYIFPPSPAPPQPVSPHVIQSCWAVLHHVTTSGHLDYPGLPCTALYCPHWSILHRGRAVVQGLVWGSRGRGRSTGAGIGEQGQEQ